MTCHDARERLSDLLDDALRGRAARAGRRPPGGVRRVPARARSPQGHGLAAPRRRAAAGPGRLRRPRARGRAPGPLASTAPRLARRRPAPPISRRGRRGGARGLARRLRLSGDARAEAGGAPGDLAGSRRRQLRVDPGADGRAADTSADRPSAGWEQTKALGTGPVEVPAVAAARSVHGPTHAPARGTRVGPRGRS